MSKHLAMALTRGDLTNLQRYREIVGMQLTYQSTIYKSETFWKVSVLLIL